jgi:hypothetical protein
MRSITADQLSTPEVITDPYPVYRKLCEQSPVNYTSFRQEHCWVPTNRSGQSISQIVRFRMSNFQAARTRLSAFTLDLGNDSLVLD